MSMLASLSITNILNQWAEVGIFSYVLPFVLIFAVVYAVLIKSQVLGDKNAINMLVALALALLSLQFDVLPTFIANSIPKFGIGLIVLLIFLILAGLGKEKDEENFFKGAIFYIGIGLAIFVVFWAVTTQGYFGNYFSGFGFYGNWGFWLRENFWTTVAIIGVVAMVIAFARKDASTTDAAAKPKTT